MVLPKDVDFYLGSTAYARELIRVMDTDIHCFLQKSVAYCRLYKIPCVNFKKLLIKQFDDYARDLDNFFSNQNRVDNSALLFTSLDADFEAD